MHRLVSGILTLAAILAVSPAAAAQTVAELTARCEQYNENYDLAIGGCTALIQSGTASTATLVWAFISRGNAYDNRGDLDKALKDYATALTMEPRSSSAFFNRGIAYFGAKDFVRAITDLNEAISIDAKKTDAYVWRAQTLNAQGRYEEAMTDLVAAQRLGLAGYKPPIEDRAQRVRKTAEAGPRCASATTDRDLRIGSCTAVIAEAGTNAVIAAAYNNRGVTRSAARDFAGSYADYSQALVLVPTNAVFASNRGIAAIWLARYDDAAASLEISLKYSPGNAAAINAQGLLARQRADYPTALEKFSRVIRDAPASAPYRSNRGITYLLMNDLDAALIDLNSAIQINPAEPYALFARGVLKKRKGDLAGSAADIAAAIAAQPDVVAEMKRRHVELPPS